MVESIIVNKKELPGLSEGVKKKRKVGFPKLLGRER
jgi:hypothetical protein